MGFIEQWKELSTLYPGIEWNLFNDMDYDGCPVLTARFPTGGTYQYRFLEYLKDVPSNVVGRVA